MHPHTKFVIPISNNIGDMHEHNANRQIIQEVRSVVKVTATQKCHHSDPKMVCDTLPSKEAATNQIWNSYLK